MFLLDNRFTLRGLFNCFLESVLEGISRGDFVIEDFHFLLDPRD